MISAKKSHLLDRQDDWGGAVRKSTYSEGEKGVAPSSVLLTDLYQLTMLQSYYDSGMDGTAIFEFFVRKLPECRNFLLAAGLGQALEFLEGLRFAPEELDWVARQGWFSKGFVDHLARLEFTGHVHAMPEGTVFFADEPILRVTAPISQAQLVESRLINLLHFQTAIASKAARSVLAAPGKMLVDFGLRRAHGAEAGVLAARATYLVGFNGTATVLGGVLYGIPVFGTMAHSFVEAHEDEAVAFENFARSMPRNTVLLIDTYDTEGAARKVVELAPRLEAQGILIRGVRIDSGDLAEHARNVRAILDRGGLRSAMVFASGNLDEYALEELMAAGAPIDGFGVGTRVDTSADCPYLDAAYKLQEYEGTPRRKWSEGKATWPGRKQVYRHLGPDGRLSQDVLTLESDCRDGEALIQPVMRNGKRVAPPEPLSRIRERAAQQLALLPEGLRGLQKSPPHPVLVSEPLRELSQLADQAVARHRARRDDPAELRSPASQGRR